MEKEGRHAQRSVSEVRRRGARAWGTVVVALLLVASGSTAGAQEPADTTPDEQAADTVPDEGPDTTVYELEGFTVEAARPVTTGGGASGIELTPDSLAMPSPSPTLSETVRDLPLIRIRQNSRGEMQPSLRGMEERQIAVLMDGVPITIGWDNRTDLSVVPVTGATRITVVRGLSSVLAGPNALGGVVEVEVSQQPPPAEPPRIFRARASVEQTGAVAGSGELNHLWPSEDGGTFWLRYGGGYRSSPGDALPDGLPPVARDGDVLLNTGWEHANGFVSGRWQDEPDGTWLAFSTTGFTAEREVLPELHLIGGGDPTPRFWRIPSHWRSLSSVSAGSGWRQTPLGRGDVEASLGLDLQHLDIDAYDSPGFETPVTGELGDDRTVTLRTVADHTLGAGMLRGSFTVADTRHEQVIVAEDGPEPMQVFQQRLWSLGIETEQPIGSGEGPGPLTDPRITVGASWDGASTPLTGGQPAQPPLHGWGARAAGQTTLVEERLEIHGGASRKVRFPALRELYSGALGKFAPNPDLDPLTLKVGEVGATLTPGDAFELQGILFSQRLEGSIVRAVLPDGRFQRQNRGETRARGLELVATGRLDALTLQADLTLQDVRLFDDAGQEADERPEYQPEVAGNLSLDLRLPGDVRASAGLEYLGRQFGANPATGEFEAVDATSRLDAGVSRRFTGLGRLPPLRAGVHVDNLTDAVIFEQLGLPRGGRTIRFQVQVE